MQRATLLVWLMMSVMGPPERPAIDPVKLQQVVMSWPALASHFKEAHYDDLPAMLQRGHIRVLTTYNSTNFFIADGHIRGFEYALVRDYEQYLRGKTGDGSPSVTIEILPVARSQLLPLLLGGYGDIVAAGLAVTPERTALADVTLPYLTAIDGLIVSHPLVGDIASLTDLAGHTVLLPHSSSYRSELLRLNRQLQRNALPPVTVLEADDSLEVEDVLDLVAAGTAEFTVVHSYRAPLWQERYPDLKIHADLPLRQNGQIAWMVRKGSPLLRASLNAFLATRRKGSLLGNIYFDRYYRENIWLKNPLCARQDLRASAFTGTFENYGRRYDLDWMLLMAMAYQESRLDPAARSPAGAVGLMQILPRTAGDRHVQISSIERTDNNVHAAAKYLAFLRDNYFGDPELPEKDRLRFALAAYNAGPGNIVKARRAAAALGLDRNRWFWNVEVAALQLMGEETVRYVRDVNKYYLAYKLGFDRDAARQRSSPPRRRLE